MAWLGSGQAVGVRTRDVNKQSKHTHSSPMTYTNLIIVYKFNIFKFPFQFKTKGMSAKPMQTTTKKVMSSITLNGFISFIGGAL